MSEKSLGSEDEASGGINSAFQSQSSLGSSLKSSLDTDSENPEGQFGEEEEVDPEFRHQFESAKAEYIQLRNQTILIQRKLLELFPALGFDDAGTSGVGDFPHRYQDALDHLDALRAELDETREHYEGELQALQMHCAEGDRQRIERDDEFRRIREAAGKGSVVSRTNKPVKQTDLNLKETQLSAKDFELEQARIEFIRTKNKFKQVDDELNKQDQLSEGLHLIDFEQLKIENQTLNEKKAEKNQDLVKIEDKIRVNAHMLTHVKEKLAFVRRQKAARQQEEQQKDDEYAESRAKLATARIKRDYTRDHNASLKKASGLIGMTDLLYDYENKSNELELMQDRVTELQTRFNDLTAMQHELEAKIAQRQPLDPALMKMNR